MQNTSPSQVIDKLLQKDIIWMASVRPDGRPHLVPIWFVWYQDKIYFCIEPSSIKARNISSNPSVSVALEDGSKPVICDGTANPIEDPWPESISTLFKTKYDWNIASEDRYTQLVAVTPVRWLYW